jgi:hypothetical protein
MLYRIIDARYVRDYIIWVKFNDGIEGEVDLRDELYGPVFEPLRNKDVFKALAVHPDLHTLVWENGADFSPEFLHESVRVTA